MSAPNAHAGDPYSLESLTAAVNTEPYRPGQIGASGLFEEDSVTTTIVSVELRDGKLGLVEPTARGGPGETTGDEQRRKIPFEVDHYQRDDSILADEVQNVREFGTETALETIENRVNRKAQRHARDLTMTLEHQRVGAIKGNVTSKSGQVLIDLYSSFGIAVPDAVSLELDVEGTIVPNLFQDVVYSIEDDLDEQYSGIRVFTGRDFHKALFTHKSVREQFMINTGMVLLKNEVPDVFTFGGATWERYKTGAKATADLGAPYIAADEARLVVEGVPELFITRFAPADYNETVNTPGLPFYSRAIEKRNGKGYDLEVQMNAISLCTKPQTLRKLTLT
ncbi:major capsid protein [Rhizobiaceae bacterium n13]|uniref:major capsid protein n=1 Tax=Ferirhizobium litorale TaxID=2927786 RepID=UPI0024B2E9B5|nr:major capsid protein [Fererhizobium litorale]MDI7864304.1 major capsid protein [Fererhizobium litorale]